MTRLPSAFPGEIAELLATFGPDAIEAIRPAVQSAAQGIRSVAQQAQPRADVETIRISGRPGAAQNQKEQEIARRRQQFQALQAQRAELEGLKDFMSPGEFASKAAGLEFDMAQFEADSQQQFADRRNLRIASRDVEALQSAFRTGQIGAQQFQQAMNAVEQQHGTALLTRIPAWRQMAGTNEQFEQQKEQLKQKRAAELGLEPELLRWDSDQGRPTFDREAFAARELQLEEAERAAKPKLEARKQALEMLARERKDLTSVAQKNFEANTRAGVPPAQAAQIFARNMEEIRRREFETRREIIERTRIPEFEAAPSAAAPGSFSVPNVDPGTGVSQTPPATHPLLPANVNLQAAFNTAEEFGSQKGAIPRGSYVVVEGHLLRRKQDGSFEQITE